MIGGYNQMLSLHTQQGRIEGCRVEAVIIRVVFNAEV
jgi:hypothetical protein